MLVCPSIPSFHHSVQLSSFNLIFKSLWLALSSCNLHSLVEPLFMNNTPTNQTCATTNKHTGIRDMTVNNNCFNPNRERSLPCGRALTVEWCVLCGASWVSRAVQAPHVIMARNHGAVPEGVPACGHDSVLTMRCGHPPWLPCCVHTALPDMIRSDMIRSDMIRHVSCVDSTV